jgi:hypothetical protein
MRGCRKRGLLTGPVGPMPARRESGVWYDVRRDRAFPPLACDRRSARPQGSCPVAGPTWRSSDWWAAPRGWRTQSQMVAAATPGGAVPAFVAARPQQERQVTSAGIVRSRTRHRRSASYPQWTSQCAAPTKTHTSRHGISPGQRVPSRTVPKQRITSGTHRSNIWKIAAHPGKRSRLVTGVSAGHRLDLLRARRDSDP